MTVVAEGVENTEQQAFLRRHACDEMQGFLFSKPVPAIEVPEFLRPSRACSPSLQPGDDDERHSGRRYSARKVARAGADAAL